MHDMYQVPTHQSCLNERDSQQANSVLIIMKNGEMVQLSSPLFSMEHSRKELASSVGGAVTKRPFCRRHIETFLKENV